MTTDTHLCDFLRNRLEQSPPRRVEPSVSLLQGFKYVPAANTNLHATFARVREQLKESQPCAD